MTDPMCRCCDVIHELAALLALMHEWGSESGAVGDMTEGQHDRYRWAMVHAADRAATGADDD